MEPFMTWLFQFLFCFLQYQVAASSSSPLSSFTSSAHPLCRHDQRSALLQFKHIFTIDSYASSHCDDLDRILSYAKTLSWDENATDCCMWDGVTCDGLTGHVIGLDLSCSKLYGKIHSKSSLFQLSHLQRLNLAFNDFKSSRISYAFGSFGSLTHLNLSDSGFSGSIPSEISHLSKLISLDLSSFQLRLEPLHFKVLLKNVTRLQELVLRGVSISSGLPDSLMNLSSLTTIDLSRTSLRGHLPDSVFHLPNLQILILSANPLLGIDLPKSTWRSGSLLRVLDLSYTNLFGELPDSIGYLKSLNYLFLAGCKLQGSIPNSIGNLMQIRALDLSECKLQGSIPNSIGNLMQIRALVLSDNNFYGEVPSTLSNLKNLTLLRLHSNNFTGPIPFNLTGLQNLKALFLDHNSHYKKLVFLRGNF